ncbi:MAG: LysM peptidoglycan-binding domain-containing protein [Anaerolineae bacterium]|nr:LysM peptidoglycan-binding domain-containing protein [Anaerolineae bacterium]
MTFTPQTGPDAAGLTSTPTPTTQAGDEAEATPVDPVVAATATARQALYLTATQIVADIALTAAATSGTPIAATPTPPPEGAAGDGAGAEGAGVDLTQPAPLVGETPAPESLEQSQTEAQQVPESCIHVVQAGENLFRIAQRYGVTVEQMAAANNIADPARIYAGQRLAVPNCQGAPAQPDQPAPQPGSGRTHVIQRGETLFSIARRYGVTVEQITAANNIANPSRIYVGQVLVIP